MPKSPVARDDFLLSGASEYRRNQKLVENASSIQTWLTAANPPASSDRPTAQARRHSHTSFLFSQGEIPSPLGGRYERTFNHYDTRLSIMEEHTALYPKPLDEHRLFQASTGG